MLDPTLPQQVHQAALNAARRARQSDPDVRMAAWLERLEAAAQTPDLPERIRLAKSHRWAGAIPTWENVTGTYKPGRSNCDASIEIAIGIDGSQV